MTSHALRAFLTVAPLVTALACSDGVSPTSDLLRNRARWAKAGVTTYQLVVSRSCECLPEAQGPVTLSVVNGVVQSRAYTIGGGPVPEELHDVFPAVPGLFDMIEQAIGLDPAHIRVSYDATLGYPSSIFVDFSEQVADEELSYSATLTPPGPEPMDPMVTGTLPVSLKRSRASR